MRRFTSSKSIDALTLRSPRFALAGVLNQLSGHVLHGGPSSPM